jgi:hypothetical protein
MIRPDIKMTEQEIEDEERKRLDFIKDRIYIGWSHREVLRAYSSEFNHRMKTPLGFEDLWKIACRNVNREARIERKHIRGRLTAICEYAMMIARQKAEQTLNVGDLLKTVELLAKLHRLDVDDKHMKQLPIQVMMPEPTRKMLTETSRNAIDNGDINTYDAEVVKPDDKS